MSREWHELPAKDRDVILRELENFAAYRADRSDVEGETANKDRDAAHAALRAIRVLRAAARKPKRKRKR